jgi:hypothetical protein
MEGLVTNNLGFGFTISRRLLLPLFILPLDGLERIGLLVLELTADGWLLSKPE